MSFSLHGFHFFHRLNLGIVHVHDLVSADWLGPETLETSGFRFDRMHGPQVDSLCLYLGAASGWDRAVALVNTLMLYVFAF